MAIEDVIDKRHERRALSARSHIGGAKIAHGGDPRPRREYRRLANLEGRRDRAAAKLRRYALMKYSLPVRSDHSDSRRRHFEFLTRGKRRVSEFFSQQKIELADFAGGHGPSFAHLQNGVPNAPRERERGKMFERRRASRKSHQRHVDAVRRSAGHDSKGQCAALRGVPEAVS